MIENLRKINLKLIELNKNNELELKRQNLIKKILSDPDCFFKMDISTSYAILRDLNISEEQLKDIYMKLID